MISGEELSLNFSNTGNLFELSCVELPWECDGENTIGKGNTEALHTLPCESTPCLIAADPGAMWLSILRTLPLLLTMFGLNPTKTILYGRKFGRCFTFCCLVQDLRADNEKKKKKVTARRLAAGCHVLCNSQHKNIHDQHYTH